MRRNCFLAVVIFLALGFRASAATFSFNLTGSSDSGSGTITASPTGTPNEFLATSMTGTFDGSAITGVLAPGAYSPAFPIQSDNLLFYPSTPSPVDFKGLTFATAAGDDVDLFYASIGGPVPSGPFNLVAQSKGAAGLDILNSFNLTPASPAPEPSGVFLLGSGLLGVAGMFRRRVHAN
jgi:hypothetical protein